MKNKLCFFALLFTLFAFLLSTPLSAQEQAQSDVIKDAEEELLGSFLDALPDSVKGTLPEGEEKSAIAEAVGFRHIFALLADSLSGAAKENRGTLLKLLGGVLSFVAAALLGGFLGKSRFADIFFSAALSLFLYSLLLPSFERVFTFLSELSAFSAAVAPLYTTVYTSFGALTTGALASGGFAVFIGMLESLVLGILSPLLKVLLALVLFSSFGGTPLLSQIEKRLRAAYVWILSLLGVLLGASLAAEKGLAAAADTVSSRTVKFAVGSSIPLVGGSVSAMLGTLEASLSLVKSTFGAGSLLVVLSLLLPVLAELFLLRLALSLGSLTADGLGVTPIGAVCDRFRAILDLLLAAAAITSAMFLILVGILSKGALT